MHRTRTLRGPLQAPHATCWKRRSKGRRGADVLRSRPSRVTYAFPAWADDGASLGKTRRSGLDDGSPRRGEARRRDRRGAGGGGGGPRGGSEGEGPQSPRDRRRSSGPRRAAGDPAGGG